MAVKVQGLFESKTEGILLVSTPRSDTEFTFFDSVTNCESVISVFATNPITF